MRATSHNQFMVKTTIHRVIPIISLLALTLIAAQAQQPEPQPPSLANVGNEFVRQIISRTGSLSTASVSFRNISVLPTESQEAVQNAIFSGFRNAGVRLGNPEGAQARVEITFSENWEGYVWIAVIQQNNATKYVMTKVARPEHTSTTRAPMMTIRKSAVWQQQTPILDFYQDNQTLALLEPDQISIYASDSGQWRARYTLGITHQQAWPRDLRGRLLVHGSQITAFLPGTRCAGSMSPPALDCRASDDPWQADQGIVVAFYSPRRNFFTGILAGPSAGASVIPFFSAAAWQTGESRQWLFAGSDGRARLYQYDLSSPAAIFNGWGSNLASIHSNCGSGWQTLITSAGDSVRPDTLQAVEVMGREAQPVSASVDLAGPVLALWTAGKNSEMVNGVLQSPATGNYEAFTLTVNCGR
jgi:hypothetical protein